MPLPLIWIAVAGVIAAGGAVAALCSDSASPSSSSDDKVDEEVARRQAEKAKQQKQARMDRIRDKSRELLAAELLALGGSVQLTTSQVIAFGEAVMVSPKGSGKQLMNTLTDLNVGSHQAHMQIAHLLAQIDLSELGLPVMDSAVHDLIVRRERLDLLRKLEQQLRSGKRLDELSADATLMIPNL